MLWDFVLCVEALLGICLGIVEGCPTDHGSSRDGDKDTAGALMTMICYPYIRKGGACRQVRFTPVWFMHVEL